MPVLRGVVFGAVVGFCVFLALRRKSRNRDDKKEAR